MKPIQTKESFVEKCNIIHNNKYNYSISNYNGCNCIIDIICPIHGVFKQKAIRHCIGVGCKKCAIEYTASKKRTTKEDFVKICSDIHNNKYDYSLVVMNYKDYKVDIICPIHGVFSQDFHEHKRGCGCKKCAMDVLANNQRANNDYFINKSNKIHNNFYDYSLVDYINKKKSVKIICPIHGVFEQTPANHYNNGCENCAAEKRYLSRTFSNEDFINHSIDVHGEKYDYSLVDYVNSRGSVKIICPIHGVFNQIASHHMGGNGCLLCSGNYKISEDKFFENCKKAHADRYDYSVTKYVKSQIKVKIICKEHGVFEQYPHDHMYGANCPRCTGCLPLTTEYFLKKAIQLYGDEFDYSLVECKGVNDKIKIICSKHGVFEQYYKDHLDGKGCLKCRGMAQFNTDDFIIKAKETHGDKYDYSLSEYTKSSNKVKIICSKHGVFEQDAAHHYRGSNCPKCGTRVSKGELAWLDLLNIKERQKTIVIDGKKFFVDGFDHDTNTVYEYYGDYWHGNPKIYNQNDTIYFGVTFGDLYMKTLNKEMILKNAGYNIISMWSSDFLIG